MWIKLVNPLNRLQMQDIMFQHRDNLAKLLALQEPTKPQLGKMIATMLMQDTMLIPPWDQHKHLKLLA